MNKIIINGFLVAMLAISQVSYATNLDKFAKSCKIMHSEAGVENFLKSCNLNEYDIEDLKKSCNSKVDKACWILGNFYHITHSYSQAIQFYEQACNLKHSESCEWIAIHFGMYKQDPNKAFKYFVKACDLGSAEGCAYTATHYDKGWAVDQDAAKAKEYRLKSCKLGDQASCRIYGVTNHTDE